MHDHRRTEPPGTPDEKALLSEIQKARMVIMPSLHEGFGMAAYEAIAAGDAELARAAALVHIAHNERWLHDHLGPADDVPLDA